MSDEPRESAPVGNPTPADGQPTDAPVDGGQPEAERPQDAPLEDAPATDAPAKDAPAKAAEPETAGPGETRPDRTTEDRPVPAAGPDREAAADRPGDPRQGDPRQGDPRQGDPGFSDPGLGAPRPGDTDADTVPVHAAPPAAAAAPARRITGAGVMIAVLLAVFGFVLVVQLRNVSADPTLAAARQEDLVRILSDLQAREQRLREDISQLESSQRQLTSGVEGGQAALEEATRRADELGILAGSLPAIGHGLHVTFRGNQDAIKATAVLDAVQELRGAGAEAMQISGPDGAAVRVVASTYFLDGKGGINVDGILLTGPYTIEVIGDPGTMRTALNIPGGVVELVGRDGGTVTMDEVAVVEVSARHGGSTLQYAQPVS